MLLFGPCTDYSIWTNSPDQSAPAPLSSLDSATPWRKREHRARHREQRRGRRSPTMASLAVTRLLLLLLGAALCARSAGPEGDGAHRQELLHVLHSVLEKLQNTRMEVWERKTSRLPVCYIGDFCSMKRGSRFGQLCDCPQGSKCNFFFLKCL
ncbi:cocaine- and amphetamine-regulated transcript protein-like [Arapaima gigas]